MIEIMKLLLACLAGVFAFLPTFATSRSSYCPVPAKLPQHAPSTKFQALTKP